jgi:uncharacterized protein YfeS
VQDIVEVNDMGEADDEEEKEAVFEDEGVDEEEDAEAEAEAEAEAATRNSKRALAAAAFRHAKAQGAMVHTCTLHSTTTR